MECIVHAAHLHRPACLLVVLTLSPSTLLPCMPCCAPQFDIQVFIRIAGRRFVIPISVRDIQFKVIARCILHMVDVMPCIGGATVSLLSAPHVDFK